MTPIHLGRRRASDAPLPPCGSGLGLGCGVMTAEGELPVEYLEPGDRIVTRDRGYIRLARIAVRRVPAREIVRVRPGVVDPAADAPDVLISARQPLVLRDWRASALFGTAAALAEAETLADGDYISRLDGPAPMPLFQLMFEHGQHVIPIAGAHLEVTSARHPVSTFA